ncbi:MAG: VCBS repeat-containing protein [Phycisphaerales bacterium]
MRAWMIAAVFVSMMSAVAFGDPTPGVAVSDKMDIKGSARIEGVGGATIISTNSTSNNAIHINQSGYVLGDAYCGPGGNASKVIKTSGGGTLTGSKLVLTSAISMPSISVPNVGGSAGDWKCDSGTKTISSSFRCDEFKVSNNGLVQISGAVTIVVDDEFKVEGSGRIEILGGGSLTVYAKEEIEIKDNCRVNENTGNPGLCRIYATGSDDLKIDGSARCYALVEAPDRELEIKGSAHLYGTYKGDELYMDGSGRLYVDFGSGAGVPFAMEVGKTMVGAISKRVSFTNSFVDPVVVCSVYYKNSTEPVVARVSGVDGSGFNVWLQNPGDQVTPAAEKVAWVAVESGAWDVGGVKLEAQKFTSSVTDRKGSWKAEQQTYLQSYTNPVVIGQVMSANDSKWSVFWSRGSSQGTPPSSTQFYAGKHVGEDSNKTRVDETVGFIVFERGHGEINGVPFDAVVSSDNVTGMTNNPWQEVDFYAAFGATPGVVIGSQMGMDGGDGGWMVVDGNDHASATWARVTIDEDVIGDSDRAHTTEQVGLVAFLIDGLLFDDVSGSSGFDVATTSDDDWGSGVMWGDLDNDGDLDAVVTGNVQSYVMRNTGGAFTAQATGTTIYRQGALFDVDNDGDLDVFGMQSYASERVLMNNGAATLADAGDLGFMNADNMEGVAAADVDGDGWCDVVVFSANGNWIVANEGEEPTSLMGTTDSLLGMNDSGDKGNGDFCSSADVNSDGYPDFFYHYNGGKLFVSNGDGSYTQNNFGISVTTGNSDKMGSAWGDFDNDGDMDLWVSRRDSGQTGYLWRNDVNWESGTGSFSNQSSSAGLTDTTGQRGCCWGDYDNDGDLDLYVVTRGSGASNVLYMNNGDGTFIPQDVGAAAPGDGHDAVFVDYDNDGDLDLAVTQEDSVNTLLENLTDDDAFLKVRVLGAGQGKTNKAAVGVRVELWSSDGSTYLGRREIGVARGYGGTEPMWLHFGGVDPDTAYTLKVYFTRGFTYETQVTPSAASTTIGATTIAQMVTIDESLVRNSARVVQWDEVSPH